MHIKQRIYASLSPTRVAALLTCLCYGPIAADPHAQAEQTTGSNAGVDLCSPEAKSKRYWPGT